MLSLLLAVATTTNNFITVGNVRVTALSPSLVRIEPRGPTGFEDRTTFNVVGRSSQRPSTTITELNSSKAGGTWLATSSYLVHLPTSTTSGGGVPPPQPKCSIDADTDQHGGTRSAVYPNGMKVATTAACCAACVADTTCVAFVSAAATASDSNSSESTTRTAVNEQQQQQPDAMNCWPLSNGGEKVAGAGRHYGYVRSGPMSFINASVWTRDGKNLLWNAKNTGNASQVAPNMLHWPSPPAGSSSSSSSSNSNSNSNSNSSSSSSPSPSPAYAFEDRPRFHVPEWGPTPTNTSAIAPELVATNGYDFTNDVAGDTYVFLLGNTLDEWWSSRAEFLTLTGPTPLLPDFAYGVWYTWYIRYTEQRAKDEIGNWTAAKLPLDVWALDMNWRNIGYASDTNSSHQGPSVNPCKKGQSNSVTDPLCRSHYYDSPNLNLLPGLSSSPPSSNEWFEYLKSQNLKTYFNDHPFPVDNQTSPKEVTFRYSGLSEWIKRGLTFWWFDHNWAFTLPGPRMPFDTEDPYEGLSGQVWGSHVYYESTKMAYKEHNITGRPIALTRDNGPNWKTAQPEAADIRVAAGSPAHHRFPVWWTGDRVPLYASVESMVDEAVHDFRAFVHSDCGGHGNHLSADCPTTAFGAPSEDKACATPNDAALLRWTAHCTFGTIMRFHQGKIKSYACASFQYVPQGFQ